MAAHPRTPPRRAVTRRQHSSFWRLIRANLFDFASLLRQSAVALTGFVVVVLVSATYLYLHTDRSTADPIAALYQSLKLLILQSDEPFPSADDRLGQALFFLVPFLGLALIAQSVLNFGRFLFNKGNRRQAWQVALAYTYGNHVIVCGLGRVGLRIITRLIDAGYAVVAIERDWSAEFVQTALNLGVPVVVGDAREATILRQARLQHARAIIAGIDGDLVNVEIGLAARALRPDAQVILRAFNEDFDRSLEQTFGINHAFSVSALGAPTFVAAAVSRDIDYALPLGSELLGVTQVIVPAQQGLSLGTLRDLEDRYKVRALRWDNKRGTSISRMAGLAQRTLTPGDTLTILGSLDHLYTLRMQTVAIPSAESGDLTHVASNGVSTTLPLQRPNAQFDTVIVCGLGKVGFRVVRWLTQAQPRLRIVVIHQDDTSSPFVRRLASFEGVTSIIGDARDADILRQADLQRVYSVAAITSDDLTNLQIGLEARRQRADVHVVLRVFSDALAEKLADLFGIHTTYSTSDLAAPTLAAAAVLGGVSSAFFTDSTLYAMDQLPAKGTDHLVGCTIATLAAQYDALVIGLTRDGAIQVLPPYNTVIAPDDELTILARLDALAHLRGT
ncbi:MAG TPA: NAD-binding protein [Ktedonobacterales bacterium]